TQKKVDRFEKILEENKRNWKNMESLKQELEKINNQLRNENNEQLLQIKEFKNQLQQERINFEEEKKKFEINLMEEKHKLEKEGIQRLNTRVQKIQSKLLNKEKEMRQLITQMRKTKASLTDQCSIYTFEIQQII